MINKYTLGVLVLLQGFSLYSMEEREPGDMIFTNKAGENVEVRLDTGIEGGVFETASPVTRFTIPESRLEDPRLGTTYSQIKVIMLKDATLRIIDRKPDEKLLIGAQEVDPHAGWRNKSCTLTIDPKGPDGTYGITLIECKDTAVKSKASEQPTTFLEYTAQLIRDLREDVRGYLQPAGAAAESAEKGWEEVPK